MSRLPAKRLVITGLLMFATGIAGAATKYVSDQLSINVRRGPGTGYQIKTLIDAGAQVQTLSKSNGWTRIRTTNGTAGYVLTRLLSDQPAAADRLAHFKKQNQRLKNKIESLTQTTDSAQEKLAALKSSNQELTHKNKQLRQELERIREVSADAMRISKQNKKYHRKLMALQSKLERLKHENQMLESRRTGMKIGALILFAGIVVGLLLSLLRKRRSDSWGSL